MSKIKTEFNVKHNQKGCYSYSHKKGIYLKHKQKEVIVLCLGSMWDNDYFKGIVIFSGRDEFYNDNTKKQEIGKLLKDDVYIESCNFYCDVGDIF